MSDSSENVVGQLHQMLSLKVKEFDAELDKHYAPSIEKLHNLSYQQFRECMIKTGEIQKCHENAAKRQIKVDFEKHSKQLHSCISKAAEEKYWKSPAQRCFQAYRKGIKTDMEKEVSRVTESFKK